MASLQVQLGRLSLQNPIMVASGTFGYAKEMTPFVDFQKLGAIVPKTVTLNPRPGNPPPRTVETAAGLLNSIGLDNDGIDYFFEQHLPYLNTLGCPIILNIAGKTAEEFAQLAEKANKVEGLAGLELNISCPNVSGGIDFSTDPEKTSLVVQQVKQQTSLPIIAKLSPNVTSIAQIAVAAGEAGADALCVANTFQGMVVNWRKQQPLLGNGIGGLSGPAIKPLTMRCVWQVAQATKTPIIAVGGIQTIDDVMEYLVTGATAVQVGTANFYKPSVSSQMVQQLESCLQEVGANSVQDIVGTLKPSLVAQGIR